MPWRGPGPPASPRQRRASERFRGTPVAGSAAPGLRVYGTAHRRSQRPRKRAARADELRRRRRSTAHERTARAQLLDLARRLRRRPATRRRRTARDRRRAAARVDLPGRGDRHRRTSGSSTAGGDRRDDHGAQHVRPVRGPWEEFGPTGPAGGGRPALPPRRLRAHHARPGEMAGGTTFHFVTDGIEAALDRARCGGGRRLGGAVDCSSTCARAFDDSTWRVPVLLGGGERLFDGLGSVMTAGGAWSSPVASWPTCTRRLPRSPSDACRRPPPSAASPAASPRSASRRRWPSTRRPRRSRRPASR